MMFAANPLAIADYKLAIADHKLVIATDTDFVD